MLFNYTVWWGLDQVTHMVVDQLGTHGLQRTEHAHALDSTSASEGWTRTEQTFFDVN